MPRPPGAQCFSQETFLTISTFNGVTNIITDAIFVVLPVPMIIGLQVNIRTKISLILILSLGFFACVASIVRVVIGIHVFEDPDFLWNYSFFIWNYAELHTGIIAACLPALRPLFASILESTSRHLRSAGYVGSRYGNKYGTNGVTSRSTRNGYLRQEDDAIGLDSLRKTGRLDDSSMYKARVTSTNNGGSGRRAGNDDDSSEDGLILQPTKGAITKRTQIVVSETSPGDRF
ncbi:hypothetical protein JX265_000088 [Neoarthrinium moseri]|uniref:Rhodopsin domain-containing protein n=1 Tax=Neoarthrinium moseri TaxID=1658444 RepID=A0A9P9WY86_9PEZI|nr:hypothetical protein JX266_008098 [Neoarthrinium moseri]KAI1881262.1 hypothetical protein JX265_000088 [Neoarthrinium moseri]